MRSTLVPINGGVSGGVPEWLKGTDCKSVGLAYVGSNPTPSTRPAGYVTNRASQATTIHDAPASMSVIAAPWPRGARVARPVQDRFVIVASLYCFSVGVAVFKCRGVYIQLPQLLTIRAVVRMHECGR